MFHMGSVGCLYLLLPADQPCCLTIVKIFVTPSCTDGSVGVCSCMLGFSGHACERMACPTACNGNGRCMSMHDQSVRMRNSQSVQYTYNGVWDANRIEGCICDLKYTGYDCSQRVCPNGDDPLTKGQVQSCSYFCDEGLPWTYQIRESSQYISQTTNTARCGPHISCLFRRMNFN
jgi:hypothetical protein